ncbi:MAG: hypothetical protein ABL962_21445, partial [Fimbriimonadaceae bacterium]
MVKVLSQKNRTLKLAVSPLGPDVLYPVEFSGDEGISIPFEYKVILVSSNDNITAKDLLHKPMTVELQFPWMFEPRYF